MSEIEYGTFTEYRRDRCEHGPDDGCMWCCMRCNTETHWCPGCGTTIDHKETVCCPACPDCLGRCETQPDPT